MNPANIMNLFHKINGGIYNDHLTEIAEIKSYKALGSKFTAKKVKRISRISPEISAETENEEPTSLSETMDLFEYMRNTNMEKESPLAADLCRRAEYICPPSTTEI